MYVAANKIGTILVDCLKAKRLNLEHLGSSEKISDAVNDLFKIEVVSGSLLERGVKEGRVGKTPPRRGPISIIPDDEKEALATLVFTFESIQQANCDELRMKRTQISSLVEDIVNEGLEKRGVEPVNGRTLNNWIQQRNSDLQNVTIVDTRQAIRVKWLTYRNQKMNHEKFEEWVVELGMARWPADEEERQQEGFVVFDDPNQMARIIIYDEMPFHLDGVDQERGGRPGQVHTNPDLPEAGEPGQNSGTTMTVMIGGNMADEAFPLYFMIPSKAKNPKVLLEHLRTLPQVRAQYGYPVPKYFDTGWTFNKKGGMNSEAFRKWYCEELKSYYPDAADVPGKRVMDKSDSGPGRLGEKFNAQARADGFYHFGSTPNCTEVCQEGDQIFGYLKTLAYGNANVILGYKRELYGPSTILDPWEAIHCFYGTPLKLVGTDGRYVVVEELVPAFEIALSPEKMREARKKCGYVPATRNSLNSNKVRHEATLDEDGEADDEADPLASMLVDIERQNHEAVAFLEERGYSKASYLKRTVIRVTEDRIISREGSRAVQHPKEYQEQLMKATASAGKWFKATNGGEPTNSRNALFAIERKRNLEKADKLRKLKGTYVAYSKIARAARKLVKEKPDDKKWIKKEFITAIRWKQGLRAPKGETSLSTMGVKKVEELWRSKYRNARAPNVKWKGDREIERLRNGDISSLSETSIMKEAIQTENEYFQTRLETISRSRQLAVVGGFLDGMPSDQKDSFLSKLGLQEKAGDESSYHEDDAVDRMSDISEENDEQSEVSEHQDSDDDKASEKQESDQGKIEWNSDQETASEEDTSVRDDSEEGSESDSSSDDSGDSKLRSVANKLKKPKRNIRAELQGNYDSEDDKRQSKAKNTCKLGTRSRPHAAKKLDAAFVDDFSDDLEDGSTSDGTQSDGGRDGLKMAESSDEPPSPPAVRRSARNAAKRAIK